MSDFCFWRPRFWIGVVLAAALLAGAGGAAQAGGDGQGQPAASEPSVPAAPPAKKQAVHCMWQNKGVTGFCAVGAGVKIGAACSCSAIIEHKTHKFPGKVVAVK